MSVLERSPFMAKIRFDYRLLLGYLIAHLLIYFTFDNTKVFWYILTGTTLFLISYTIMNEDFDDEIPLFQYLLFGIISGAIVYGLVWIGNYFIELFNIRPLEKQVNRLYSRFAPENLWHYVLLVLIIVPGEEIFWRGFILKRMLKYANVWTSILASAVLYGSVYIFTDYPLLILAAFTSGIVWGIFYVWKRSLPLVIISHLTFSLLLFLILPLR